MPLIVGLGNPGREYSGTPHNAGFEVLALLAERWRTGFRRSRSGQAEEVRIPETPPIVLLRPLSYMNLSGNPVASALRWHGFSAAELLVVCDDVNLMPGHLRFRVKGGAGGQKGLRSIIEHLGTEDFHRLRIGVGGGDPGADVGGYVLSKPPAEIRSMLQKTFELAADAIECYLRDGIEIAMNRYNTSRDDRDKESPSGDD